MAPVTRRDLLRQSAFAAAVAAGVGASLRPASAQGSSKRGDVILFQGDSITDARRDRKSRSANHSRAMGYGYPLLISSALLKDKPDLILQTYNRGISGNKVPDLDRRWDADCLQLKPAVLSILIGVNDIWHKLNGKYDGTVETYRTGFAALLKRTREALPETKIAVCEPFVLRCGAVKDSWFPEMDQRRAAAKDVATEAKTLWVPFQTMFDEAVKAGTPPAYWAGDGVHPTMAGHALMAETWRKVVGL